MGLKSKSKEIIHYTDINALKSILENKTLRFGHYRFLNDEEEFVNGQKILLKKIKDILNYGKANNIVKNALRLRQEEKEKKCPFFVCSFSKKKDDLDLWRAYTKENGVAIVFDREKLEKLNFNIYDVVYNNTEKSKKLDKLLDLISQKENDDDEIEKISFALQVWNYLDMYCSVFKNIVFKNEQEARVIINYNDDRCAHTKREFRISGNIIIPYIEVKIDGMPYCIKEIIINPFCKNRKQVKTSLREFLNCLGLQEIDIKYSNIRHA